MPATLKKIGEFLFCSLWWNLKPTVHSKQQQTTQNTYSEPGAVRVLCAAQLHIPLMTGRKILILFVGQQAPVWLTPLCRLYVWGRQIVFPVCLQRLSSSLQTLLTFCSVLCYSTSDEELLLLLRQQFVCLGESGVDYDKCAAENYINSVAVFSPVF